MKKHNTEQRVQKNPLYSTILNYTQSYHQALYSIPLHYTQMNPTTQKYFLLI